MQLHRTDHGISKCSQTAFGASGDIQPLVFANTDVKYINDIDEISNSLGPNRLFLLVNPFWRNVDSWSFNILAPNAKEKAQSVVFDQFQETSYHMMVFYVRGEKCAAVKAYPNDWQIFGLLENSWGGNDALRLGSIPQSEEPTSAVITEMINQRPEFKETKTMRQMKNMF